MSRLRWTAIVFAMVSTMARAEEALLDELLEKHAYRMSVVDDRLEGAAVDFLVANTSRAQFVGFAEPHNVRQVPQVFSRLFRTLHEAHDFNYMALETGPAIMRRVSQTPVRGNLQAITELYFRYPRSFHFYTDQELAMMADVGALSTTRSDPIWGVDQIHATPLILDELIEVTSDQDRRARLERLSTAVAKQNASDILRRRGFIALDQPDLSELADWYRAEPESPAEFLIEQLALSHRVYRNNIDASSGAPTGYISNVEREENMKYLFLRHYRRAHEIDGTLPKVLVKQGHWHLLNGRSPGNAYTLGSFLREFAKSNGREFFNIAVSIVNESEDYFSLSDSEGYEPLTRLCANDAITVFDLRPLRSYSHAGQLPNVARELRSWIYQYDAALIIGGGSRGSYEASRMRNRARRPAR